MCFDCASPQRKFCVECIPRKKCVFLHCCASGASLVPTRFPCAERLQKRMPVLVPLSAPHAQCHVMLVRHALAVMAAWWNNWTPLQHPLKKLVNWGSCVNIPSCAVVLGIRKPFFIMPRKKRRIIRICGLLCKIKMYACKRCCCSYQNSALEQPSFARAPGETPMCGKAQSCPSRGAGGGGAVHYVTSTVNYQDQSSSIGLALLPTYTFHLFDG